MTPSGPALPAIPICNFAGPSLIGPAPRDTRSPTSTQKKLAQYSRFIRHGGVSKVIVRGSDGRVEGNYTLRGWRATTVAVWLKHKVVA